MSSRQFILFLSLFSVLFGSHAFAQQIRLEAPTIEEFIPEAPDFASEELGNAWDFQQRRDIGFEVGYHGNSVSADSGVWRATNSHAGAYTFPLFGGYSGSLFAEGPSGSKDLPRFGANHPIDASKYYFLSIRSRSSAPSTYSIYWNSRPEVNLFPDGSERGASFDGYYFDGVQATSNYEVRSFDLRSQSFEQMSGAWSGKIAALRFDPSVFAPAGSLTEIDWIRLVDPASAPTIDIRWSLADVASNTLVTVYLDTDGDGYDGTPLARFIHGVNSNAPYTTWFSSHPRLQQDNGMLRYPSAALPPGTYYFYVTLDRPTGGAPQRIAQTQYSAPIRITAAPSGYFVSPAADSGTEYAASELGNPWDMNELSDVANALPGSQPQELRQFSSASSVNGVFQATADAPLPGNNESDSQLRMNVPANKPISANTYRYLTYRIAADPILYPSIEDKVRHGWVTRPVFWNTDLFYKGGSFKAHILYEGMHTYTIDLWDDSQVESGLGWRGIDQITHLRIDPLETTAPTWFFVDSVSLHKENAPQSDRFEIVWNTEDIDSSVLYYSLYLDNDAQGANGTLLESRARVAPGFHRFVLDTNGMAPGRYYPYVEVFDEGARRTFYSDVPIVVGGAKAEFHARPSDFDGDGISDPVVYRPAQLPMRVSGTYYVQPSAAPTLVRDWGLSGYVPVKGDFDGDRKTDVAAVANINGMLHWFVIRSSDGGLYYRIWGYEGDLPAVADYNGDNRDEIAVFRAGQWYSIDVQGAVKVAAWGQWGDIPVPADFDGDGMDDIAIWRPATGTWWVISSAYEKGEFASPYIVTQWGLPGDIPQLADFNNDGRTDFLVWRPATGTWYLQSSDASMMESWQWGLPGDIPHVGYYTSKDAPSFSIWRPSTGQWFHRGRDESVAVQQWGLPGDVLPQ